MPTLYLLPYCTCSYIINKYYIYTYIYIHIHTHIHTYMHACIHTYIHTYTHTYIHTSMQTDRQTEGKYVGICSMCLSFSHFQSACSPFFTSKPRFGRVNFVLKPPLSGYLFKHKLPNTSLNVILRSCHP